MKVTIGYNINSYAIKNKIDNLYISHFINDTDLLDKCEAYLEFNYTNNPNNAIILIARGKTFEEAKEKVIALFKNTPSMEEEFKKVPPSEELDL